MFYYKLSYYATLSRDAIEIDVSNTLHVLSHLWWIVVAAMRQHLQMLSLTLTHMAEITMFLYTTRGDQKTYPQIGSEVYPQEVMRSRKLKQDRQYRDHKNTLHRKPWCTTHYTENHDVQHTTQKKVIPTINRVFYLYTVHYIS